MPRGTVDECCGRFILLCVAWFEQRFPDGPTEPQSAGWREIAGGGHALIAAPTGSGKTLAAFLVCIDRLYRAWEAAGEAAPRETLPGPSVVYVSPLKALAVDIQQNLEAPLREIAAVAAAMGLARPPTSGSPSAPGTPPPRSAPPC